MFTTIEQFLQKKEKKASPAPSEGPRKLVELRQVERDVRKVYRLEKAGLIKTGIAKPIFWLIDEARMCSDNELEGLLSKVKSGHKEMMASPVVKKAFADLRAKNQSLTDSEVMELRLRIRRRQFRSFLIELPREELEEFLSVVVTEGDKTICTLIQPNTFEVLGANLHLTVGEMEEYKEMGWVERVAQNGVINISSFAEVDGDYYAFSLINEMKDVEGIGSLPQVAEVKRKSSDRCPKFPKELIGKVAYIHEMGVVELKGVYSD